MSKQDERLGSGAKSPRARGAAEAPQGQAAHGGQGSILVVDDDAFFRKLIAMHLSGAGYDVRTAEDAMTAGRLLLERAPDLILLDVEMPFMNGYEFATALQNDPKTADIPIAFITGDDDVGDRMRRLRAVAHLRKPILADRLLELVALYMPAG